MNRVGNGSRVFEVAGAAIRGQSFIDALVVTGAAVGHAVCALQRKLRHVVIETGLVPKVLYMAFAALRQLAVVIVVLDVTDTAFLTTTLERSP